MMQKAPKLAAFLFFLIISKTISPSLVQAASLNEVGSEQLCLAGLMSEFSWSDGQEQGQGQGKTKGSAKMGTYSHSNGEIHVFKSRRGSFMCRVDRNRILWADSRGQWRDRELDTYISYQINDDQVIINRRFHDGSTQETSVKKLVLKTHVPSRKSCVPVNKKQAKK